MLVVFFSLLSLTASVVCMLFGILVLVKDFRSKLNRIFMLLCISMSYWSFTEFQLRQSATAEQAHFWIRANFLWLFTVVLLFHFILIYTDQNWLSKRKLTFILLYGSAAVISLLDLNSPLFAGDPVEKFWGWGYQVPETISLYLVNAVVVALLFVAQFFAIRFFLHQDDLIKKKQARLVLLGLSIPIIVGTIVDAILRTLLFDIPEMSGISFAVGIAGFIGYAIWKYELFGITPEKAVDKIFSSMADSLFIVDPNGIVLNANSSAMEMLGYREKEIVNFPLGKIFGEHRTTLSRSVRQGDSCAIDEFSDLETALITKEGRSIPVSLSSSTLSDKSGIALGRVIVARDITDRKVAEVKILAQSEELKSINRELLTLNQITAEISQTIDLDSMLKHALTTITDSGMFEIQHKGGIFIAEGEKLNLVTHIGHDDKFMELHKDMTFDDCLCGLAARTGKIIISSHSDGDDRHTIRYPGMEDHGHAIIPLKTAEQVVGVLYMYLPAGAEMSKSGRDLLQNIGRQLAVSIENAKLYEETKEISLHDPLTGLANRNLMKSELEREFGISRRTERPVSVIMLDLDRFKNYNDTYGHAAGDKLLVELAALITREIRTIDVAARYGGEEFLVILPDSSPEPAALIAERIRKSIELTHFFPAEKSESTHMTVSLGVATYEAHITNADMLVARADSSLYRAKQNGRNRVEVWLPLVYRATA